MPPRPPVTAARVAAYIMLLCTGTSARRITRSSSVTVSVTAPRICATSLITRPTHSAGSMKVTSSTGSSRMLPPRCKPSWMPMGVATMKSSGWVWKM